MLFSIELAARGTRTFSLHPGLILGTGATADLADNEAEECNAAAQKYAGEISCHSFRYFIQNLTSVGNTYTTSKPKSVQQGCATGLVAALDPDMAVQHNGAYLEDCQVAKPYAYASSPEKAKELWELSEKLVGHPFDQPKV